MKNLSLWNRFCFAVRGIKVAFQKEKSFRLHFSLTVLEFAILFLLGAPPIFKLLLMISAGAVLSFELVNTAMEHMLDLLHPQKHESARIAKDCAAGAVLLMALISGAIVIMFLSAKFI